MYLERGDLKVQVRLPDPPSSFAVGDTRTHNRTAMQVLLRSSILDLVGNGIMVLHYRSMVVFARVVPNEA